MSENPSQIEESLKTASDTLQMFNEYKDNNNSSNLCILENEDNLIRLRPRITFSRLDKQAHYPDLLDVQLKSFKDFLQEDVPPSERKPIGLQAAFLANFPVVDASGLYQLEFIDYSTEKPKLTESQCTTRELTYAKPLKARLRLSSKTDK